MNIFSKLLRDESGAAAAEYALILAIVGSGIAFAAFTLGGSISAAMGVQGDRITDCSNDPSTADCGGPAVAP